MRTAVLTLAGMFLVSSMAPAAPFDAGKVSADAKWLVHLDVDAMHDSVVVKSAFEQWTNKEDGQEHLDKARRELGLDLRDDLHSITLYNIGYEEHEGVVVASAEFDREKLEEKVQHARGHTATDFKGVEIHTWADHKHKGRTVAGAFFDDKTLVIGSGVELVQQALRVLAGELPGLSDNDASALTGSVPKQTILLARVIGLADAKLPHKSRLPAGIDQLSIAIGEQAKEAFMVGRVGAEDEQTAEYVKNALEGLRSMALLKHGDTKAKKYLEQAAIVQSGDVVELEFTVPAEVVLETVKKTKDKRGRAAAAKSQ